MKSQGPRSVTQSGSKFTVAASPFNEVKLELGLVLVMAVIVWSLVESVIDDLALQLIVLAGFGVTAMSWLIWRVRRAEQRASRENAERDE